MAAPADPNHVVWAAQPGSQQLFLSVPYSVFEVLFEGTRGGGKSVDITQLLLTDRGWVRAGDVTEDDQLVAPDGTFTPIFGIYPQGVTQNYRVTFADGCSLVVSDDHRWQTWDHKNGCRDGWQVLTTDQLRQRKGRYSIPLCDAAPGWRQYDGPDPYMAGLLLGDGTTRSNVVTLYSPDEEILQYAAAAGMTRAKYGDQVERAYCNADDSRMWKAFLGEHKGPDKRIPDAIMAAGPDVRLACLQGLLDTDGSTDPLGRTELASCSLHLIKGAQHLVRSLGGKANFNPDAKPRIKNSIYGNHPEYRLKITHCGKFPPFRLPRKAARINPAQLGNKRLIVSIEPAGRSESVCFAVAHSSHQFVCQDYIVTHNTDCLLMDFAREVGTGMGPEWTGYLFKRTNPELRDVKEKIRKFFPRMFPGVKFRESPYFEVLFPDGEKLMLRHMGRDDDYWDVHGSSVAWIGWEELSNWPTPTLFLKCMSLIRSSHPVAARKKRVRATTNPGGPGHNWIRDRYQLPYKRNQIIEAGTDLYANKWLSDDQRRDLGLDSADAAQRLRMAIFSDIRENKIFLDADPGYLPGLAENASSEAQMRAWVYGDWDIVAGGMFDDVWDIRHHWIKPFPIPSSWTIDRSFDWGESKPFSLGYWAQSDGSDVRLPSGKWVSTVRGDLFRIGEVYGWNGKPNEGCKMTSSEIAEAAVRYELSLGIYGRVHAGPADTSIFSKYDGKPSVAEDMAKPLTLENGRRYKGISFVPARKGPDSRVPGWALMRKAFKNAIRKDNRPRERPGLFVFSNCDQFARTVPVLPRSTKPGKSDDVDTEAEDHIADEARYRVTHDGRGMSTGLASSLF